MANDMVPGGEDGSLVVSVDSRKALASLNVLESRMYGFVHSTQTMFNRLGGGMGRFNIFITNLTRGFNGLFGTIAKFVAIRQLFVMLEGFVSRMVEVNRVFTGFIASMSIIRGSVEGAAKEYQFLLAISNRLGVSVEASITQYHRLAAALKNVDASGELARHIFSGISQAAVVLHSKGRDVTLIFEAVQQMASKGKLSLEELQRQLGNTLPGAISMAARAMMQSDSFVKAGVKTVAESEQFLRKSIEKGTINVYEFLARLSNQLKKEYGQGVAYASSQFEANFNRMKNSVFEFYRMVGSSQAIDGLVKILREITALFNDNQGQGARGLGQALGAMFSDIANWISKIESKDVSEFFESIKVAMGSTMIIVDHFLEAFKGIGGPEMETPLLDFVEFVARTLAALVDIFRVAVAGIETAVRTLIDGFNSFKQVGFQIGGFATDVTDNIITMAPWVDPNGFNRKEVDAFRARRAAFDKQRQENYESRNAAGNMFLFGPGEGNTAFDQVGAQFQGSREKLLREQYGALAVQNLGSGIPGTENLNVSWNAVSGSGLPAYLMNPNNKAGSTADAASAYINPLGDSEMQKLLEQIYANSGAPNQEGNGKGKGKRDPVQSNFLREQTRLLKDISVAENEYQNILAGRNRKEGENEAQMRSLLATDERYIALSKDKKAQLLGWAQQLDEVLKRVQNAIKAQDAWNDSLVAGYDVQARLAELASTGYESKYRESIEMQNSFREGGENEFMDMENRRKMMEAAMKKDNDQRILDMARYTESVRQANDEMLFQADLIGRSALEQQKMIEFRKIDLQTQQLMVGATDVMKQKYLELAEILKGEVSEAFDEVARKQQDAMIGVMQAVNGYMDQVKDRASEWGKVTENALAGMEDALVRFVETGKLSFSDLARSMAKDLVRLITRYMMLLLLQRLTGAMAASSGGASGVSSGGFSGGSTDYSGVSQSYGGGGLPAYAKGGAFNNGVQFFAGGGVFDRPMAFPMANGKTGVAFEDGPEAIMPLARDKSGNLGVRSVGGGDGESIMNLTVEVYQGEGKGVKTERTSNEKGDILKIMIGEVAADIQRGGPVAKAITQVYGVKRKPKVYS